MAKIEVPSPPDTPCKSCIRRKNRTNPYDRLAGAARWAGLILAGLAIVGIVAAFAFMVIWGIQNGQYDYAEVEVAEVQSHAVNGWIFPVTIFGGLFGIGVVAFASTWWWGTVSEAWDEHSRKWDQRKRMED